MLRTIWLALRIRVITDLRIHFVIFNSFLIEICGILFQRHIYFFFLIILFYNPSLECRYYFEDFYQ